MTTRAPERAHASAATDTSPVELSPVLAVGTVLSADGESPDTTVVVSVQARAREARRAASCLLAPLVGDSVLVALHGERVFVLSILERTQPAKSQLELGGGVRLEVEGKAVALSGADSLELAAKERIDVSTRDLQVRADKAGAVVKTVEILGRALETSFHHVKSFASQVDALADTFSATMKRSLRVVSDVDMTRARVIDTRAEGTLTMHAENTAVTARQVTKIDSSQIQIG